MRICLYTGTALPKLGGQEAVVDALARQFLALGHQPMVLAPRPRLPLRPRDAHLPYPVLRHTRFVSTQHLVGWYRRWLLRAYCRRPFDILHCHDVYPTGYLAALAAPKMQVPWLITSHGGDVRAGNARLAKFGMRPRFVKAVSAANALVSIGRFTEAGFLSLGARPGQIVHIPNGVDLAPFAAPAPRPPELDAAIIPGQYVLLLGRLSHRKGADLLLDAAADLMANLPLQFVIAGSGDQRASLERQIQEKQLANCVRLVGRVAGDVKTYLLQNALCTVVPSRGWEAFPLVVLESYAAGRPVIATAIAGLEDVVRHGETGLLVPPESRQALAAAIGQLCKDAPLARRMGAAAARLAGDFNWQRIARLHLDLYARLLTENP